MTGGCLWRGVAGVIDGRRRLHYFDSAIRDPITDSAEWPMAEANLKLRNIQSSQTFTARGITLAQRGRREEHLERLFGYGGVDGVGAQGQHVGVAMFAGQDAFGGGMKQCRPHEGKTVGRDRHHLPAAANSYHEI